MILIKVRKSFKWKDILKIENVFLTKGVYYVIELKPLLCTNKFHTDKYINYVK